MCMFAHSVKRGHLVILFASKSAVLRTWLAIYIMFIYSIRY